MLNELSLFSGYGGFSLGLKLAGLVIRTVAYVEWDSYCQQIIHARIKDGLLDDAPIYGDICAFDGQQCRGVVDLITGGFPCQDLSTAGKRAGLDGKRSGLWWEMLRCIREVGPRYVLIENVPGILVGGQAGTVVGELSGLGYDSVWHCVPAAAVGAPHLRWRWWCFAYPNTDTIRSLDREPIINRNGSWNDAQRGFAGLCEDVPDPSEVRCDTGRPEQSLQGLGERSEDGDVADPQREPRPLRPTAGRRPRGSTGTGVDLANPESEGLPFGDRKRTPGFAGLEYGSWWQVEPPLGRVADGCPDRVGQLRALGNGIVPAVVAEFLKQLEGQRQ